MRDRYFGYTDNAQFCYWTYDREVVFSSEAGRQNQSYQDEYEWFTSVCDECGYEPECYED